jgi:hypothetical protein
MSTSLTNTFPIIPDVDVSNITLKVTGLSFLRQAPILQ